MQHPQTPQPMPANSHPLRELGTILFLIAICSLTLAAWFVPGPKEESVFGRLNYGQFLLAVFVTAICLGSLLIMCISARNRRAFAIRLLAIGIGLGTGLAVGEFACWLLPGDSGTNPWLVSTSDTLYRKSRRLMFQRLPNIRWQGLSRGSLADLVGEYDPYAAEVEFVTDYQGFHNSRDLHTADLVFIGDSHTEAGYIDEMNTFAQQTATKTNLQARNLGIINYSPAEELVVLEEFGIACNPQAVIWQICEHNDLYGAVIYDQWAQAGMPDVLPKPALRWNAWRERSPTYHLYQLCRRRKPWPYQGVFQDHRGVAHSVWFGDFVSAEQSPTNHPGWPLLAGYITQGARLLRENNIPLIILLVPMKHRVMGDDVVYTEMQISNATNWDLPEENTMAHYLKKLCKSLEVGFIDSTPRLKQLTANGVMAYLPLDTHLTVEGHEAVSDLVVTELKSLNLSAR